jgi:DNA-binding ferritin-like protein
MAHSATTSKSSAISEHATAALCELLNRQIADTIDLQLHAKKAASAVKKPPLADELTILFNGLARDLIESIDILATRITVLGGRESAIRLVTQESRIADYVPQNRDGRSQLEALLSSYSKYDCAARSIAKAVQQLLDPETSALLETMSVCTERNLWLLQTHVEAIAVGLHGRKLPHWTPAFEDQFRNIGRNQRMCSHGV